jgi:hypothetical protein
MFSGPFRFYCLIRSSCFDKLSMTNVGQSLHHYVYHAAGHYHHFFSSFPVAKAA